MALPGIRVVSVMSSASNFSLLIAKATPADPAGFSGSGELKTAKRLEKSCSTCVASSVERCVSCRARIPICRERRAFDTAVHFDMGPGPVSGEECPLMFRVAILILAWWPLGEWELSGSVQFGFVFHSVWLGDGTPWRPGRSCGSGVPPGRGPCTSLDVPSVGMRLHLPSAGAGGTGPKTGEPGRVERPV